AKRARPPLLSIAVSTTFRRATVSPAISASSASTSASLKYISTPSHTIIVGRAGSNPSSARVLASTSDTRCAPISHGNRKTPTARPETGCSRAAAGPEPARSGTAPTTPQRSPAPGPAVQAHPPPSPSPRQSAAPSRWALPPSRRPQRLHQVPVPIALEHSPRIKFALTRQKLGQSRIACQQLLARRPAVVRQIETPPQRRRGINQPPRRSAAARNPRL